MKIKDVSWSEYNELLNEARMRTEQFQHLTLELNIPLLRKEVEWVESEAERKLRTSSVGYRSQDLFWNQASWLSIEGCGTGCCLAGNVALNNDVTIVQCTEEQGFIEIILDEHGDCWAIEDYARIQLGLSRWQAGQLFFGANKAEDIRKLAEAYAGERL